MMRTLEQFKGAVIKAYVAGKENALEAFLNCGYQIHIGETDLDFLGRALEQDYHDADYGGCIYADYLEA